ncbi:MAG: NifB/NifX family molybdenum-iron cluster-binding protein [Candidatus Theseobacter exili]|nr:NifB/NifX family molybdenum-iron cluster-binding protein [Candidatus Theseobacter exili]
MNNDNLTHQGEMICITSTGNTLSAPVDARFGRCKYFIIINTGSLDFEAIENPYAESRGGAGIQSGQMMSERNVNALLTGNIGPNAFQTLRAAGVKLFTGVDGTVEDAVKKYTSGVLKSVDNPSVSSHFGMKE